MLSFLRAARASRLYGRSLRLRARGQSAEALGVARYGLSLASGGESRWEDSAFACLAVEVERLAPEVGEVGLTTAQLQRAILVLKESSGSKSEAAAYREEWLPKLESRLGGAVA